MEAGIAAHAMKRLRVAGSRSSAAASEPPRAATGYITAKDMLTGRQQATYAERDRKLRHCDIEQRSHRHDAAFDNFYAATRRRPIRTRCTEVPAPRRNRRLGPIFEPPALLLVQTGFGAQHLDGDLRPSPASRARYTPATPPVPSGARISSGPGRLPAGNEAGCGSISGNIASQLAVMI
jgi:hypothetical protein